MCQRLILFNPITRSECPLCVTELVQLLLIFCSLWYSKNQVHLPLHPQSKQDMGQLQKERYLFNLKHMYFLEYVCILDNFTKMECRISHYTKDFMKQTQLKSFCQLKGIESYSLWRRSFYRIRKAFTMQSKAKQHPFHFQSVLPCVLQSFTNRKISLVQYRVTLG